MTIRSLACGAVVACVTAAASPAAAGIWTYGCKGNLGDDQVIFDRESLVVLPRKLPAGNIRELVKREIAAFDAADNNSGLQPTMEFMRGAYPNQKVTLTEKSSRKTSERNGHVGTREESTTTFKKLYRFVRAGGPASLPRDIEMDCVDYMLTAP
jgi:hypothetical protein